MGSHALPRALLFLTHQESQPWRAPAGGWIHSEIWELPSRDSPFHPAAQCGVHFWLRNFSTFLGKDLLTSCSPHTTRKGHSRITLSLVISSKEVTGDWVWPMFLKKWWSWSCHCCLIRVVFVHTRHPSKKELKVTKIDWFVVVGKLLLMPLEKRQYFKI